MKNILKQIIIFTTFLILFTYCIKYNNYITNEILRSCNMWLTKVVPSLFPSFILVDLLCSSSLPYYLNKHLKINVIYFLSILSGSPTNAYLINNYDIEKTKLLAVTKYTSLIFTFNFLKIIFNTKTAILLIISNILANLILTIIIKPPKISYPLIPQTNIGNIILTSLTKNINTLLTILSTIIFFNILPINMIENIYIKSFLLSIFEVTNSFINLSTNNLPFYSKIIFTLLTLSSGGLCIEMQIKSILKDTSINYLKYFKYRLIHFIFISLLYIHGQLLFF